MSKPEYGWTTFLQGSNCYGLSYLDDIPFDWLECTIKGLKDRRISLELFLILLCFLLFPVCYFSNLFSLPLTSIMNISMDIAALAIVLVLNATTIYSSSSSRGSRAFSYLVLVEFVALYTDIFAWTVDGVPGLRWANVLDNTLFYLCSVGIAYFYLLFVEEFLHLESKAWRISRNPMKSGA